MKKSNRGIWVNLALISQVGVMMVVPIAFGVILGNFIDNKVGTAPLFLIIMIVFGVGTAFRNLMHLGSQQTKKYRNDYSPHTLAEKYARRDDNDRDVKDQDDEDGNKA